MYNNAQQIDGTLKSGFYGISYQMQSGLADLSRDIGHMGSAMNMGFALLNNSVLEASKAISDKLENINTSLAGIQKSIDNKEHTEYRFFYNRAVERCTKEQYEEALEDLELAIQKEKTSPFPYFLMGKIYLCGIKDSSNIIDKQKSNVIDLSKSIEAFKNAEKYIAPDAKNNLEAKQMAAEICFYLGLACQNKAYDDFHLSNNIEYEKNLDNAKTAYKVSWDYSHNMLESLYNLARCQAITNEKSKAIENIKILILKDNGYFIKAYTDSDFDNDLKNILSDELKKELYPLVKPIFDNIEILKAEYPGPYSDNLTKLLNDNNPESFTKDTPAFDMLMAKDTYPKIVKALEKHRDNHLEKIKIEKFKQENKVRLQEEWREKQILEKAEKKRREEKQQEEQKRQSELKAKNELEAFEYQKRVIQYEKIEKLQQKKEAKKKALKKIIGWIFSPIPLTLAAYAVYTVVNIYRFYQSIYTDYDTGSLVFIAIVSIIPFILIYFTGIKTIKGTIISVAINIIFSLILFFAITYHDVEDYDMTTQFVRFGIYLSLSSVMAKLFPFPFIKK